MQVSLSSTSRPGTAGPAAVHGALGAGLARGTAVGARGGTACASRSGWGRGRRRRRRFLSLRFLEGILSKASRLERGLERRFAILGLDPWSRDSCSPEFVNIWRGFPSDQLDLTRQEGCIFIRHQRPRISSSTGLLVDAVFPSMCNAFLSTASGSLWHVLAIGVPFSMSSASTWRGCSRRRLRQPVPSPAVEPRVPAAVPWGGSAVPSQAG